MSTHVDIEARAPTVLRPRRWPAAMAALAVVFAVVLTGWLYAQDRANTAAASASRANAARDALAVMSLRQMATSFDLANSMEHEGIYGLKGIGLHAYLSDVIEPLGGSLHTSRGGWTLALGGGWGCLRWDHDPDGLTWARVTRGVCTGAPIESTPIISHDELRLAIARTTRLEGAAQVAASAIDAANLSRDDPTFTVRTIADEFRGLSGQSFRWTESPYGVTVVLRTSAACLQPTLSHDAVDVSAGRCP